MPRPQLFAPCRKREHDDCVGAYWSGPGSLSGETRVVCDCLCHRQKALWATDPPHPELPFKPTRTTRC
jgi:hypothetical protein